MSKQTNYWFPILLISALCIGARLLPLHTSSYEEYISMAEKEGKAHLVVYKNKDFTNTKRVLTSNTRIENRVIKGQIAPLNFYYKAHKFQIDITTEITTYFEQVERFLADNPSTLVTITGHSDDGDSQGWNDRVAKYRATQAKEAMLAYGMEEHRVKIAHKSNAVPFNEAADATKNRRVEIRIQ